MRGPRFAQPCFTCYALVKELIRDIDPDAHTKPKLSASTTVTKEAKKARREEAVRRKAVQEEMGLIANASVREAPGT